ncbi:hypothetical protein PybrP1_013175, partial [[Pythium] brassicae (nom. inval.)]
SVPERTNRRGSRSEARSCAPTRELAEPGVAAVDASQGRLRRIRVYQGDNEFARLIFYFLESNLANLTWAKAQNVGKIADQFAIDRRGVLLYLGTRHNDAPATRRPARVPRRRASLSSRRHVDFRPSQSGVLLGRHILVDGAERGHLMRVLRVLHMQAYDQHSSYRSRSSVRGNCVPPVWSKLFHLARSRSLVHHRSVQGVQEDNERPTECHTIVPAPDQWIARTLGPNRDPERSQGDWDEVVEKLMWSTNTSLDATQREAPFSWFTAGIP